MFKPIGSISAKDVQKNFKITEQTYLDKYQGEDTQKSWQDYLIEEKDFHRTLPPKELWELRQGLEKANGHELQKAPFIPLKEALDLSGYPVLISSGIKSRLYDGYKLNETIFEKLVTVEQSSKRQEQYGGLFETDLPEEVLPGEKYQESTIGEKKVFISNKKYGKMLNLDMELIWHDQQNEILRKAQTLGRGARLFQEKFVIDYLVDANDNGYRTTSSPTGSAIYSTGNKNLLTTALSATQLEVAIQQMRNQVDDKGNPILVMPDTILGPTELDGDFHRIMKAQGRTGVANQNEDGYNYLREKFGSRWTIMTSPYFSAAASSTPTNDWYMMSRAMGSLIYQEVMPLTVLEEQNGSAISFERDIKRFKVMLYFGVGLLDHRSVFANRVA